MSDFNLFLKDSRLIISLTSYPNRFKFLEYTLKNVILQSRSAHPIVVNLHDPEFRQLPKSLIKLERYGVVFMTCPINTKVYLKMMPSALNFPDKAILTIDDDIFYPPNWLSDLILMSETNPHAIVGHRGAIVPERKNSAAHKYSDWIQVESFLQSNKFLMLTGVGGIVYPAGIFPNYALDAEMAENVAPGTDDLWFYAISEKLAIPRICLGVSGKDLLTWPGSQNYALWRENVKNGRNDLNFLRILAHFEL